MAPTGLQLTAPLVPFQQITGTSLRPGPKSIVLCGWLGVGLSASLIPHQTLPSWPQYPGPSQTLPVFLSSPGLDRLLINLIRIKPCLHGRHTQSVPNPAVVSSSPCLDCQLLILILIKPCLHGLDINVRPKACRRFFIPLRKLPV